MWVARHDRFDLNITVVAGTRGLVVVDTHAAESAARDVLAAVRRLGAGDVVAVVNTHEHFDHVLGNAVFRDADPGVPIHAHAVAAARMPAACERIMQAASSADDPFAADVLASRVVPPDRTFDDVAALDLGDREVALRHLGRGHTAGDLVARVPDVDVVVAGDLVEEGSPPVFGPDSHPLDWPATAGAVADLVGERGVVVPGHGAVVDRRFVVDQQAAITKVTDRIRACHAEGLTPADALAGGGWPWDPERLADAVDRGYGQLASEDPLPV